MYLRPEIEEIAREIINAHDDFEARCEAVEHLLKIMNSKLKAEDLLEH